MEKDNKFEVLAIRMRTEDKIAIMQYAERKRMMMSTWARSVLMREMERDNENQIK